MKVNVALALLGFAVIAIEGHYQPSPGVGFAIGFCLMLGAALYRRKHP